MNERIERAKQEQAVDWLKKTINIVWLMNPNSKVSLKVETKEIVVTEAMEEKK